MFTCHLTLQKNKDHYYHNISFEPVLPFLFLLLLGSVLPSLSPNPPFAFLIFSLSLHEIPEPEDTLILLPLFFLCCFNKTHTHKNHKWLGNFFFLQRHWILWGQGEQRNQVHNYLALFLRSSCSLRTNCSPLIGVTVEQESVLKSNLQSTVKYTMKPLNYTNKSY